jgi:hypothetical protein
VWDRPWAPHEEARGSCCTDNPERAEMGRLRNPIKVIEEKGGGIFEMDWHERAKLLRQLVDWQCECGVGALECL